MDLNGKIIYDWEMFHIFHCHVWFDHHVQAISWNGRSDAVRYFLKKITQQNQTKNTWLWINTYILIPFFRGLFTSIITQLFWCELTRGTIGFDTPNTLKKCRTHGIQQESKGAPVQQSLSSTSDSTLWENGWKFGPFRNGPYSGDRTGEIMGFFMGPQWLNGKNMKKWWFPCLLKWMITGGTPMT